MAIKSVLLSVLSLLHHIILFLKARSDDAAMKTRILLQKKARGFDLVKEAINARKKSDALFKTQHGSDRAGNLTSVPNFSAAKDRYKRD